MESDDEGGEPVLVREDRPSPNSFYETEVTGLPIPDHTRFSQGDRSILINWMLEVCNEPINWNVERQGTVSSCMGTDVYFLAVSLYDRYASRNDITPENSQLIGTTCMWIATKFFDWGVDYDAQYMTQVTAGACNTKQLRMQEVQILKALNWELQVPTPADHMQRMLDANQHPGVAARSLYFLEMYSMAAEYVTHKPRDLAAACIVLGCKPSTLMDYGKLLETFDKQTITNIATDVTRFHTLFNLGYPPFVNDMAHHSAIHILYGISNKLPIVSYAELTKRISNDQQNTITHHFKKRKLDSVQPTTSMKSSKN